MTKRVWAGLDVGVETTSVCVIDDAGEVLHQARCPTRIRDVHREISWLKRRRFARVGIEASGGSNLARGLRTLGYSVDLYETRQLSKFLRVKRNKTDAGDASGIADAGRVGASLISKVYLKSLECQSLQSRLVVRQHLIQQRVGLVNLLCRQLELFGGRIRRSGIRHFSKTVDAEIKKLFGKASNPLVSEFRYVLDHCQQLIDYQRRVDRELTLWAADNEVCRRFMEIPGVGPICALTFYAAVGDPHRFRRSSAIGAYFGLTPKLYQSGLTLRLGRISKMGSRAVRSLLVRCSVSFMQSANANCDLRRWASAIEQRRGRGKARVALARKLAIIMLAMWKTGDRYKPSLLIR